MNYPRTILTIILVFGSNNVVFAQPDVELAKTAVPEIQAQIRTTVLAFLSGGNSESDVMTNWKGYRELTKLKELADDEQQLVKQLAIYAVIEQREEQSQVIEALLVLQLLKLKPSIPIRVLAPQLDSDNPQIRELARNWFQSHDICAESPTVLQALNYSDYLDYVRGNLIRHEETPPAFIEYIYERSPDRALMIFSYANPQRYAETVTRMQEMRKNLDARLQQENNGQGPIRPLPPAKEVKPQDLIGLQLPKVNFKEIHLAQHVVSNAIWFNKNGFQQRLPEALPEAEEQLAKLSEHSEWWVRLYVAEIMRQHRELRQANILEKLSHDSNALVSKSAKSVLQ